MPWSTLLSSLTPHPSCGQQKGRGRKQAEALSLVSYNTGLSPVGDSRPSLGYALPHLQLRENLVTALGKVLRRPLSLLVAGSSQECRAQGGRTGQWE